MDGHFKIDLSVATQDSTQLHKKWNYFILFWYSGQMTERMLHRFLEQIFLNLPCSNRVLITQSLIIMVLKWTSTLDSWENEGFLR